MRPTKRYSITTGKWEDTSLPKKRRKRVALHTRFKPFRTHQIHEADAKACGLRRVGKMTVVNSEAELNRYLAREKELGRETGWKDW